MRKFFRPLLFILLFTVVFFVGACSKTAENEHLPEYCQTYSGFTGIASRDFYELLREAGHDMDRTVYFTTISEISLEFEVDDPNREIDLSGIQCFQNLTNLTLVGTSFKDLSPISALHNIQSIELIGTSVVSIDSFSNLSKIKSLVISDTRTLQSVKGVEEMTKLTILDLSRNGIVNIDGLNNLTNLTKLYFNDNEIVEFPSINMLVNLETLDISDNNINKLGDDLSGLSALEELYAQNNEICDLSTLDDLVKLEILNLSNNDLGCGGTGVSPNFDSLENAPNLEELYLDNNNLTSIEGLRGRDINLKTLHLNENNITDITPIGEYTDIEELVINGNNITNIDDLSGMTGLTIIDLSTNNISDFSDLLTVPSLTIVNLSNNNITTIPDISASWGSLSSLNLSNNQLTDTSGVNGHPSIEELILYNNGLIELSGISNMPNLETLTIFDAVIEGELDIADQNPNNISIIRDSFNYLDSLVLHEDNTFNFGFELGENVEIYNSIKGLETIATIDFKDMDIDVIDSLSITLPFVTNIGVDGNNITDISFILGNPSLEILDISGNPITNLDIISGVATTDFDNLEQIKASDILVGNHLSNSFIELDNLEVLDLTQTYLVTITNSINDLESLEVLNVDADELTTITNSFNNIYSSYAVTNTFRFWFGKIGHISNSFNNGEYFNIIIQNQETTLLTTIIEDSFNNIIVHDSEGIVIMNSLFATIDNSFNGIETEELNLTNNVTETITDSFVGSTIYNTLNLSVNMLQTVPSLNQVTNVDAVFLQDNILDTLDFIDAIPGITSLNISDQTSEVTLSYTLASINGVNNMPTLTSFIYNDIGITSIDGLKNLGIDSFALAYSQNNNKYISSISATSFTGTDLITLDLGEHQLNEITFIDNLDILQSLSIGIDLVDLSDFQAQSFEATLEILELSNQQAINDFIFLSGYDSLTDLTINSILTNTINNLDGLDSMEALTVTFDNIVAISNSFNTLASFNPENTYLLQYTTLSAISNSFDIYGTAGHNLDVTLKGDIVIVNSFNNLISLTLTENIGNLAPNFDTDSFDNIEDISFENGDYDSYSFLDGYTSLTSLGINTLSKNITDLNNDNIVIFYVLATDASVATYTLDLANNAAIALTSSRIGAITINSDANTYDITALSGDTVINSTATILYLDAKVNNFILNASNVTAITLHDYQTTTTTFNTNLLTTVSRSATFQTNAFQFTVNSLAATINISVRTNDLIINNNNATNYTVLVDSGNVTINNVQTDVTMNITAIELDINYNTLETIDFTGSVGVVSISSDNLITFTGNGSSITLLDIGSEISVIDITGSNVINVNLTNNSLTSLTMDMPGTAVTLNTTNNQPLNLNVIATTLEFNGNNIASITINDLTNLSALDLTANSNLNNLAYGNASISSVGLSTGQTTLDVSGNTISTITLSGANYIDLNLNASLATFIVNTSAATLSADLDVNNITFNNTPLVTLNIDALSTVSNVNILNSVVFTTLNTNGSYISNVDVGTAANSINIQGIHILNTTIIGDAFTLITANVGTNNLNVGTNDLTGTISIDVISDTAALNLNTINLDINDTSNISTLNITGSAIANIDSGSAPITLFNINDANTNLDITGSNITTLNIDANVSILDLILAPTANVTVITNVGLVMSTNTNDINLTASGDSTISSTTLENATFNLGTNNINFIVDKINLDFIINGTANEVTVSGINTDNVLTTANTNITTLILDNIFVADVDFTLGTVLNLEMNTLINTITITGDELRSIILNGTAITSVTASSNYASSTLEVNSNQTTLILSGSIDATTVNNNTLTSLTFVTFSGTDLVLNTNSLSTLNTGTSIGTVVSITTNQTNFTLDSNSSLIIFEGSSTGTLNLTSSTVGDLTTNTNILNLNISSANLAVVGLNLNQVNGDVLSMSLGNTLGALLMDISATATIQVNNDTATSLTLSGVNTINLLDVDSSSLSTLTTNSVTINKLKYAATNNAISITTKSPEIELIKVGSGLITLNYGGATTLDLISEITENLDLNITTASTLLIEGTVLNIAITGNNLTAISASGFEVNEGFTMNNTLITDVAFMGVDILANMTDLEMNTLSNTNVEAIINKLDGYTLDLVSPITSSDIYNHFYDYENQRLTILEATDTARYISYRDTAINNAWAEIITNQYMDHLDEITTKAEIDNQIYQSVDEYYISYLINDGIDELDLTPQEIQDIKDAIQVTLNDPLLTVSVIELNIQVTDSIDADADTYALLEQGNITFTIS